MMVISALLTTAFFGPGFWSVSLMGISLRYVVVGMCLVMAVWQFGGYFQVIFWGGIGKNGSTVADTSVLFPLFPLLAVMMPICMIYTKSTSGVFDQNITLYALLLGAVAAKATNRLVIAHMSKSELDLWDWIYVSPLVMMLNQYADFYVSELLLLKIATVYAYANLIFFCWMVTQQFCAYLRIYCFTITSRPPARSTSASSLDSNGAPLVKQR